MAEPETEAETNARTLETLSNVLTQLSEDPYNISLHAQHLQLVSALGQEEQATARQMFISFWPATDDIWLPIIESRLAQSADSEEDVMEIMTLFQKAEGDYLCGYSFCAHL